MFRKFPDRLAKPLIAPARVDGGRKFPVPHSADFIVRLSDSRLRLPSCSDVGFRIMSIVYRLYGLWSTVVVRVPWMRTLGVPDTILPEEHSPEFHISNQHHA